MAANLAYLPAGAVPCSDLTKLDAAVWYPIVPASDGKSVVFGTADSDVAACGYLYPTETALGLKVGALKTPEQAKKYEGARGICPPGWHIPTLEELLNLVGKGAQLETRTDAPYYDKASGNATISALNADGFNIDAYGTVTIKYNSSNVLSASLMGYLSGKNGIVSSGFMVGSSFKTYTTWEDESVKTITFHGLMPFASNNTCNISGNNIRNAAPLRCIRDKSN